MLISIRFQRRLIWIWSCFKEMIPSERENGLRKKAWKIQSLGVQWFNVDITYTGIMIISPIIIYPRKESRSKYEKKSNTFTLYRLFSLEELWVRLSLICIVFWREKSGASKRLEGGRLKIKLRTHYRDPLLLDFTRLNNLNLLLLRKTNASDINGHEREEEKEKIENSMYVT